MSVHYGAGDKFDAMYKWVTIDDVRWVFDNIDVGDRVTFYRRSYRSEGPYHGIIVARISSSGVTAHNCNRVDTDMIGYELMTWKYIFNSYKYVNGGVHHNISSFRSAERCPMERQLHKRRRDRLFLCRICKNGLGKISWIITQKLLGDTIMYRPVSI